MSLTREEKRDAHAKSVARNRKLIAFVRENSREGYQPYFKGLAQLARQQGLVARTRVLGDVEHTLAKAWRKRLYWESDAAETQLLSTHTRLT